MPKLHQNMCGGRAPPGPAGGAYALSDSLRSMKGIASTGRKERGGRREERPTYKVREGRWGDLLLRETELKEGEERGDTKGRDFSPKSRWVEKTLVHSTWTELSSSAEHVCSNGSVHSARTPVTEKLFSERVVKVWNSLPPSIVNFSLLAHLEIP